MPDGLSATTVLDTHVWIWIIKGDRNALSARTIAAVEDESRSGRVRVSAISVWKVAMLEAKGRITLSRPVGEWVRTALRAPGVRLLPLDPAIAIESTRLPGHPQGDPADRILIASTRILGARLATCDRAILDYSAAGHMGAMDCRI